MTTDKNFMEIGAELKEIVFTLPSKGGTSPRPYYAKREALSTPRRLLFALGVKLHASPRETEAIICFVRQGELELLRKASGEAP